MPAIKITISADAAQALAGIGQVRAALAKLKSTTIKIAVDQSSVPAQITDIENRLKNVRSKTISIRVNVRSAIENISRLIRAIRQARSEAGDIRIGGGINLAQFNQLLSVLRQIEESTRRIADNLRGGGRASGDMLNKLGNLSLIGSGLAAIFEKLKQAVESLVMPGIEFNMNMEKSRLGISGILMSMLTLNGGQMKLNEAMQISDGLIKQIQVSAAQIGLPAEEMTAAFQSIIGPGLAAKMTLDELVKLVPPATKAVKTMLGSMADSQQVTQELRAMVSGDITMDAQVSRALGITKQDVDEAKKNAGGLFAYLMGRLEGFKALATEWPRTMTGALEKFKTSYSQAAGSGFEKIFDKAKDKLNELTGALFVLNKQTKLVEFNPELLDTVQEIVDYVILLTEKVEFAGKVVTESLGSPLRTIGDYLKLIIDNIYGVTAAIGTWVLIQKMIVLMELFGTKIAEARVKLIAMRASVNGATVAVTRMEAAVYAVGTAIKGLGSATLWGAIAVAAGYAVEKIMDHFSKLDRWKKEKEGIIADKDFGWLSKSEEGDYGAVSTGKNDPYGGPSYGSWQFSSKQGTARNFVEWLLKNGWEVGKLLKYGDKQTLALRANSGQYDTLTPGTKAFGDAWEAAAERYGRSFEKLQRTFMKLTYYDPVNAVFKRDFGFDADKRSAAMREVLTSTSVLHGPGGAWDVFNLASKLAGAPNVSYLTDEQLIPYIYAARTKIAPEYAGRNDREQQKAMNDLAMHPQKKPLGKIQLDLKNPAEDPEAKAIANARIKLAKAVADGKLQEYLAKLQQQEQALENQYKNTKSGKHPTGEKDISETDYTAEKKRIETAKAMAEIENLQQQLSGKKSMLANVKLKDAEKINVQADITRLESEITVKKKKLDTSLQALDGAAFQAQKALDDQARDVKAANYEDGGNLVEAVRIRLEKQNRALKETFAANGMMEALKDLQENENRQVNEAKLSQSAKNIELANDELIDKQNELLSGIADGTKSAGRATQEFIDAYHAKMDGELKSLRKQLEDAMKAGNAALAVSIKKKIQEVNDTISEFLEKALQRIDSILQDEIARINANPDMTNMQRQDAVDEVTRRAYADKTAANEQELQRLRKIPTGEREKYSQNGETYDDYVAMQERQKEINSQLSKMPTLLDKIHRSSKQAFEDGLLDFLQRGILECNNLADAFRNLAISILQSIQKVYAEALTKNIMNALFPVQSIPSGASDSGVDFTKGLSPLWGFADGGSMNDGSGVVRGPGTGVSDSIMAWVGNLKKFVRISNGEFVMRAEAVRKFGPRFMEHINNGMIPQEIYDIHEKYASGGLMSDVRETARMPGALDLASSLNNNVNVPVTVANFTDPAQFEKFLSTRRGEQVITNYVNKNATMIKRILNSRR